MKKPYVVGIAGSSGSGKTFFLKKFLDHFASDEVTIISQDDYYFPANTKTQEENKLYNFDVPEAIDRDSFQQDILDLFHGKTVWKEEYTFNNPNWKPKMLEIKPAPLLIVEGLFIYHFTEIDGLFSERIFLHADEPIALERRLKRDLVERGYFEEDVRYKWEHHVLPGFEKFLLPYRTQCDLIVENNTDDPELIQDLTDQISARIRRLLFNSSTI